MPDSGRRLSARAPRASWRISRSCTACWRPPRRVHGEVLADHMAAMVRAERAHAAAMAERADGVLAAGRAAAGMTARVHEAVLALIGAEDVVRVRCRRRSRRCWRWTPPRCAPRPPLPGARTLPPGTVGAPARRPGGGVPRATPPRRGLLHGEAAGAGAARGAGARPRRARRRCWPCRRASTGCWTRRRGRGRWPSSAGPWPPRWGADAGRGGAARNFSTGSRHERRASPLTVEAYGARPRGFLGFLTGHLGGEPDLAALAGLRAGGFPRPGWRTRRATGAGAATRARHLSAVRSFFRFLARRHGVANPQLRLLDTPQARRAAAAGADAGAGAGGGRGDRRGVRTRPRPRRATWRCSPCSTAAGCAFPRRWR